MKKCKHCPQKKYCKSECYGENPCDFALAFDKLARRIDLKTVCIESLKEEIRQLKEEIRQLKEAEARQEGEES